MDYRNAENKDRDIKIAHISANPSTIGVRNLDPQFQPIGRGSLTQ